jgi:hypothetical protein
MLCEIGGAHGSNYEDNCPLGSENTVQSGRMLPMVQRNTLPQSPNLKMEAGGCSKMSITSLQGVTSQMTVNLK